MAHEHPDDLIAAYALDALPDDERAKVDAHLATCAECRQKVRELTEVAEVLALAAPEEPRASSDLRSRILQRAAITPQHPGEDAVRDPGAGHWPLPRQRVSQLAGWLVAAAFLVLTLILGVWNLSLQAQLHELQSRPVLQAALQPGPDAPGATGTVAVTSDGHTLLTVSNLAPPGPGMVYEAWIIDAQGPKPAGTFVTTPDGRATLVLAVPASAGVTIAITAEPAPGRPQPSGQVLLKGTV